jgi:hypothetical protein
MPTLVTRSGVPPTRRSMDKTTTHSSGFKVNADARSGAVFIHHVHALSAWPIKPICFVL